MKTPHFVRNALLTSLLVAGVTVSMSASAVSWRGWNTHGPGYANTIALEHFAEKITERTNGDIKAKMYNSAVLGEQIDAIQQTMSGAIQFANFNMSPVGEYVPETNIVSLPYLFKDIEHQHRVMDGEVGDALAEVMREKGLVVLSWFDSGVRSFYNNSKPIEKPDDLKGMKIRVQESDLYVDTIKALGGNPTPMPFGDVYQGLANGVVDGAENNYPSYKSTNHFEVAKYYSEDKHFIIPECLCVSSVAWDALSDETKEIVREEAQAAAEEQRKLWAEAVESDKQYVIDNGAQINEIDDLSAFQDAMAPVYEKFYTSYPDQKDMVDAIRAID